MGFGSIFGFVLSFFVILGVFLGSIFYYVNNLDFQNTFLEESTENFKHDFYEDYSLSNFFLDSGRYKIIIENKGLEKLFFKKDANICFDFFLNENFLSSSNFSFKILNNLENNYFFIEKKSFGKIYFNKNFKQNDSLKAVSCQANIQNILFNQNKLNFFSKDYLQKKVFQTNSKNSNRKNKTLQFNFNSDSNSDFDFNNFDKSNYNILCDISNYYILNLPFDKFKQNLNDYSIKNYSVTLGSSSSINSKEPNKENGILFSGLNFNKDEFVRIRNFQFDNLSHTISFWFKSSNNLNKSSKKIEFFNFANRYKIVYNLEKKGKIGFYYNDLFYPSFSLVSNSNSFLKDKWYNIVFVIDNSKKHKVFINGVLDNFNQTNLISRQRRGLRIGNI